MQKFDSWKDHEKFICKIFHGMHLKSACSGFHIKRSAEFEADFYTFYKNKRTTINTEAKRCFATHDEDIDYFNMRIYIILIACVYIQQFNFVQ